MNKELVDLVDEWRKLGSIPQEGFDWTPRKQSWIRTFPGNSDFISNLPKELDRDYVRQICQSMNSATREKFLAVMVWGYGELGYGPYRVSNMLKQTDADTILNEVVKLCLGGDPKGAYNYIRINRVRGLGPSYSSKFISFCTPREIGAPIFDSFIALWIEEFAKSDFQEVSISSETWNSKTYESYWDWVKHHSDQLNCYPDEIELVLFRDAEARFGRNSGWSGK